eukprot:scaffold1446_cov391-Prasinococcus_capsulatus_cf.AAC.1
MRRWGRASGRRHDGALVGCHTTPCAASISAPGGRGGRCSPSPVELAAGAQSECRSMLPSHPSRGAVVVAT